MNYTRRGSDENDTTVIIEKQTVTFAFHHNIVRPKSEYFTRVVMRERELF